MKLLQLAKTIRSKGAGVDHITFDVIFDNADSYRKVRDSGVITREFIANLYNVPEDWLTDFTYFEPAPAIKFTMRRAKPSGSPGCSDVYGSQQYAPLMDIEIPE
ncbi:MAG: DUF4387 domain-containing protein [Phycisphaerae bacterium]|nr:DUF4387 domain-containing protein [Phycisphaerae bacterium]